MEICKGGPVASAPLVVSIVLENFRDKISKAQPTNCDARVAPQEADNGRMHPVPCGKGRPQRLKQVERRGVEVIAYLPVSKDMR